jgi:DUF2975 family protein
MSTTERSNAGLLKFTLFFLRLSQVCLGAVAALAVVVLCASIAGVEGLKYSSKLAALDAVSARHAAIVFSAVGALCAAAAFAALRNLVLIVHSARDGDPFIVENGRRLRGVGALIVVINVVAGIGFMLANQWLHVDTKGANGSFFSFPFSTLITVLLIFVLASIFEQGARMRSELQATI